MAEQCSHPFEEGWTKPGDPFQRSARSVAFPVPQFLPEIFRSTQRVGEEAGSEWSWVSLKPCTRWRRHRDGLGRDGRRRASPCERWQSRRCGTPLGGRKSRLKDPVAKMSSLVKWDDKHYFILPTYINRTAYHLDPVANSYLIFKPFKNGQL